MRRKALPILIAISLAISIAPQISATAAPKTSAAKQPISKQVVVKKLDLVTTAKDVEGLVAIGKTLITYSNTGGVNSNILLIGLDATGLQLWQKTLDSGVDEVALAATADSSGNLWIAGASAPVVAIDTRTVQTPTDNPDGVVVEQSSPLRGDLNLLTLWKVSSQGELLATYSVAESAPALINGISANASGVSIVGQLLDKPFLISASPLGVFGKLISIGGAKTQINSVVRNSDGSINVFGSSAETLGGKKLVGIRDGVLIKISKTGNITTVVRSSAPKGNRSWINSDNSLALTGYVKTGKVLESAFTKFTSAFVPTWTIRVPSHGGSVVLSAVGATYAAIGSNSVVSGVSGWKPSTSQLLLLALDSKGVITAAYSAPELADPISLTYSKEIGLYGLAKAGDGTVSIFHLSAR
jgi:hypothetical protein